MPKSSDDELNLGECCGKPVTTPFCPYCGRQTEAGPLFSLLDHCRKTADRYSSEIEACKNVGTTPRVIAAKNATKWQRWTAALARLMQENDGMEGPNAKTETP